MTLQVKSDNIVNYFYPYSLWASKVWYHDNIIGTKEIVRVVEYATDNYIKVHNGIRSFWVRKWELEKIK